jgi:YVTN family beta-propeller protein
MRPRLIRALAIPAAALGTLALAGAAAIAPASPASPASPARAAAPPPTAYVVNYGSNTVTAINTATNKAYSEIKVGGYPDHILIAPNGKTAYVSSTTGVTRINTVTQKAGKLISFWLGGEAGMAITPNGKTLYVTGATRVIPVSTATGKAGKPITVPTSFGLTGPLLVTPNGKTLYAGASANSGGYGMVIPISTTTGKAGKPIKAGNGRSIAGSSYMAITPDGKTLYAFASGPYGPGNTVTPISTATNKAGKPITVGQWPGAIVVSPNGKTAYVASSGQGPTGCIIRSPQCGTPQAAKSVSATVTPISTVTNRPGRAITLGHTASLTMAITPNGRTVYVGYGSAMIPVSTATNKAGKPIKLGWEAGAMAITANSNTIYCLSANGASNQGVVIPVRIPAGTVLKAIYVGVLPMAIAIAP